MLVLLDLDGTLINSFDVWAAAYRKAVYPINLTDEDIVKDFLFSTPESLLRHGVTNVNEYYIFVRSFIKDNPAFASVEANAEEALDKLREQGHTLGILTARSKEIATAHCSTQLLSKFKIIIDRGDALPKPDPEGVFKACKYTGISINQTVLVGDHPIDAKCSENAGIHFLLYKPDDHPFRRHNGLEHLRAFSSFKELPDLVKGLKQRAYA